MKNADITVIVTIWKRDYLAEQLVSLLGQTCQPAKIIVLQNEQHSDIQEIIAKYRQRFPPISLVRSDYNFKYFFRFTIASLVETPYIFLVDDDVIPGKRWLETCVEKCRAYNAVIACSGRIIPPSDFRPEEWEKFDAQELPDYFIGNYHADTDLTHNYCPHDKLVDYGCNSYFFKTSWIRHFWSVWPDTFDSGEDIHLSASLKIAAAIPTYVPEQLSKETSGNLKKDYGLDAVASWTRPDFISIRERVLRYLVVQKRWAPILWSGSIHAGKKILNEH